MDFGTSVGVRTDADKSVRGEEGGSLRGGRGGGCEGRRGEGGKGRGGEGGGGGVEPYKELVEEYARRGGGGRGRGEWGATSETEGQARGQPVDVGDTVGRGGRGGGVGSSVGSGRPASGGPVMPLRRHMCGSSGSDGAFARGRICLPAPAWTDRADVRLLTSAPFVGSRLSLWVCRGWGVLGCAGEGEGRVELDGGAGRGGSTTERCALTRVLGGWGRGRSGWGMAGRGGWGGCRDLGGQCQVQMRGVRGWARWGSHSKDRGGGSLAVSSRESEMGGVVGWQARRGGVGGGRGEGYAWWRGGRRKGKKERERRREGGKKGGKGGERGGERGEGREAGRRHCSMS